MYYVTKVPAVCRHHIYIHKCITQIMKSKIFFSFVNIFEIDLLSNFGFKKLSDHIGLITMLYNGPVNYATVFINFNNDKKIRIYDLRLDNIVLDCLIFILNSL